MDRILFFLLYTISLPNLISRPTPKCFQYPTNFPPQHYKPHSAYGYYIILPWWQNEDKTEYLTNPDGERLFKAVVFSQSPENGVEIFRNVCLREEEVNKIGEASAGDESSVNSVAFNEV